MADQPDPLVRQREVRVFANRYGELFNDDVRAPSGHLGSYLRWRWSTTGVLAIPVSGNRVALIPAFRYPIGAVSLEFPRGAAEADESPVAAALRELSEESGFNASGGSVLGEVHAETGLIESTVTVVLVDVADHPTAGARPERMESVSEPLWFDDVEVRKMISGGAIKCGLTLSALAMWWSSRS